ncbi:tyrosine-type recombinase/integrase [Terasakiella pusilla]|uniref:tyrosine-type recombinase/integrase n=1 Tax=Terasakiella pusilla TaxID=64973 RepID=UPI003AA90B77
MRIKKYRGQYCIYWRENGKPKRVSLRTDNYQLAKQRFEDYIKPQAPETVDDFMDVYLKEKEGAASHDRMIGAWKQLKPHCTGLRPDQVNRKQCKAYIKMRSSEVSNGTICKELGILKAALNFSDKNSPAVFEMPPRPAPKERYLNKQEYRALLAACRSPYIKLFVILALSTAGRQSAILELTWDRIDFTHNNIKLSTAEGGESKKGRATVPMTAKAREALLEAKQAALTDYVIEYNVKNVKTIKKAFERACQRAGLTAVTPHTLRHTAAVWMAVEGASMSKIAQYLGHSDSRITERVYARFSPQHLSDAASALDF